MFVLKKKNIIQDEFKSGLFDKTRFLTAAEFCLGAISKEDLKQGERNSTWTDRMIEKHIELQKAEIIAVESPDHHPLAAIVTGLVGLH